MRLLVLSDLHLESSSFKLVVPPSVDIIVLAGDIFVAANWDSVKAFKRMLDATDKPVLYLPGNHEYYHSSWTETHTVIEKLCSAHSNLHNMFFTTYVASHAVFVGAPLWTDFALDGWPEDSMRAAAVGITDFHCITVGDSLLTPSIAVKEHERARTLFRRAKHENRGSRLVFISHWLPSFKSVQPRWHGSALTPYFASNCEDLMGGNVKLWIHGHTHDSCDYVHNGTRVICNPKGYKVGENKLFNPQLVVDV